MNAGAIIRLRRKSMGLSQKKLSYRLGVSSTTLSRIENNSETIVKMSLEDILKITKVLKLNPVIFLEEVMKQ